MNDKTFVEVIREKNDKSMFKYLKMKNPLRGALSDALSQGVKVNLIKKAISKGTRTCELNGSDIRHLNNLIINHTLMRG